MLGELKKLRIINNFCFLQILITTVYIDCYNISYLLIYLHLRHFWHFKHHLSTNISGYIVIDTKNIKLNRPVKISKCLLSVIIAESKSCRLTICSIIYPPYNHIIGDQCEDCILYMDFHERMGVQENTSKEPRKFLKAQWFACIYIHSPTRAKVKILSKF